MHRRSSVFCVALVALSTSLVAQKTWIVDASGGGNFTDIPPAFAAAKPGDTVIVRRGQYSPAITSKGIRLFGEAGITFRLSVPGKQFEALIVRSLPQDQTFTMEGFDVLETLQGRTILYLDANLGRIHLEDLRFRSFRPDAIFGRPAFLARNSVHVTVTGCSFEGRPGARCEHSTVAFTGCEFLGGSAWRLSEMFGFSHPGLSATRSRLAVARSKATGGAGAVTLGQTPASPAMILIDGDAIVSGDAQSKFEAGDLASNEQAMHALELQRGILVLDPSVRLVPKGTGAKIKSSGRVVSSRPPSLVASGAPPGAKITTDLFAQAGTIQLLLAGAPAGRIPLPFGDLWFDPSTLLLLDASIMGAGEHRARQIPVPAVPGLAGVVIVLQALNGPLGLSTPAAVVLR